MTLLVLVFQVFRTSVQASSPSPNVKLKMTRLTQLMALRLTAAKLAEQGPDIESCREVEKQILRIVVMNVEVIETLATVYNRAHRCILTLPAV